MKTHSFLHRCALETSARGTGFTRIKLGTPAASVKEISGFRECQDLKDFVRKGINTWNDVIAFRNC
jgi:hypothetical protein